jgi:hypothetical protein
MSSPAPSSSPLLGPALAVAGTLAGFLLLEVACRTVLPLKPLRSRYKRVMDIWQYDQARVQHDPELGFLSRPGLDTMFENPELGGFSTRVRTNSAGLRDDEASLTEAEVYVLGDSFGFGWGVEQADTVEGRLEAHTKKKCLNLGQSGYGTTQQLLLLKRVLGERRLDGKTVVLMSYWNDLEDVVGYGFGVWPRLAAGEAFATEPSTPAQFAEWQRIVHIGRYDHWSYRASHVAFLLGRLANKVARLAGAAEQAPAVPQPSEDEAARRAVLTRVMGELARFVRDRGGRLVALYIPTVAHYTDQEPSHVERVQGALEAHGVPLLDTSGLVTLDMYWSLDGHWKPLAHDLVARKLIAWMKEQP